MLNAVAEFMRHLSRGVGGTADLQHACCHTDSQDVYAILAQSDASAKQPLQVLAPVSYCSLGGVVPMNQPGAFQPSSCGVVHEREVNADAESALLADTPCLSCAEVDAAVA